jgi:type I restriction enzyme R subunit
MSTPEQRSRIAIDDLLTAAGWAVQNRADMNLGAKRGVAVCEFPLKTGYADYLLFIVAKVE